MATGVGLVAALTLDATHSGKTLVGLEAILLGATTQGDLTDGMIEFRGDTRVIRMGWNEATDDPGSIRFGDGADNFNMGPGNDVLRLSSGSDILSLGYDNDTLQFNAEEDDTETIKFPESGDSGIQYTESNDTINIKVDSGDVVITLGQ